ncbi:conserved hypothetical protein [Ricinus communis]|uniref:Uncharacterized protein n=1 Tax=Ricinus communis TaxID=3988 RepID=B9TQH1_RICCO|nr:conserved hypothetical protein [Ricinus communis]
MRHHRAGRPRDVAVRRARRGLAGDRRRGCRAGPPPPSRVARLRRGRRVRARRLDRHQARRPAPPPRPPRGPGPGGHPEPAELPVLARHVHHRRRRALRRPAGQALPPGGRGGCGPDGAVAPGPRRALPDRRRHRHRARRGRRRYRASRDLTQPHHRRVSA